MSEELVEKNKQARVQQTRALNSEPRDTYRRYGTPSYGELDEGKKQANALYDAWLASLTPGDMVYYNYRQGWGSGGRTFTTVNNITKSGMIRLADDTLVGKDGTVKGKDNRGDLQPFTEEYHIYNRRKKVLSELNRRTFFHLTNEGLELVMVAIMQAEEMLPQMLEAPSEK